MKRIRLAVLAALIVFSLASQIDPAHAGPNVEAGFSPEGSAHRLVLKVIGEAKHSVQILAFSFRAPDIMQALADAQKRGVKVRVVADRKRNLSAANRKAMRFVTSHGVELRTNSRFHLHHDKIIIADGETVLTGSFNFTVSAGTKNSENVVVIRGMPDIARQYLAHWQSRWDLGVPYKDR